MLRRLLPMVAVAALVLPTYAHALQVYIPPPDPIDPPDRGGSGGTTPVVTPPPAVTAPVVTPAPVVGPPTLNLSTGLNASGALQTNNGATDAYWTVTGPAVPNQSAQVSGVGSASHFAGWAPADTQSSWIVVNSASATQPPSPYNFTRLFDLSGLDVSNLIVSGSWSGDDSVILALNGITLGIVNDPDYTTLHDFTATSSELVQGVNTLTATMDVSDQITDGFRLEGAVIANTPSDSVPEPVSLAIFGTGLAGVAFFRRRNA